ncbi:MAG: HAMP domain-containing histidine kinase [Desulfobacteraceae bacterium]|nr:HAMP domain-containing histidine kinase [Desulfobacteraceae bacterium]
MRLTIFSRVMIAQSTLIALILIVSLFALSKLNLVSRLSTEALTVDTTCINEEKRLLKSYLAEMRNGEKFALLRDPFLFDGYEKNRYDFTDSLSRVASIIDTDRERALASEIAAFHAIYEKALTEFFAGAQTDQNAKLVVSEGIVERINELIRLREQSASDKIAMVRDQADSAATVMFWLTLAGIAAALGLAYLHARGISRPLSRLAREMRHVGRGEFTRSLDIGGPSEVKELAGAFNLMSEELEHLDRLKADFTAHVSHELRTPLTAIREGTALLLEAIPGPLADGQRQILEVVRSHSERLFHSITSILDLSKMEAEMMDYDFTACDLRELITGSIEAVDLIARKRKIEVHANIDGTLPMLLADERRIRQVLDNLLSNALKFSSEGSGVKVEAHLHKDRQVEILVIDSGPGIPEEDLQSIFKHFYQSTNQGAKGQQGTGLGLAIARHIVEAHNGRIWAESRMGEGSTFHFTLPVHSGWNTG